MTDRVRKKGSEKFYRDLETLFHENYPLIYRAAYGVLRRPEDAEDVLQTIFVRLIEREELPPDFSRNPKAYLHTAAINEALHVKDAAKRRRLTDVDLDSLEISVPATEFSREDDLQRMRDAMTRMKPALLAVLDLHYKQDYSCAEIAKMQGIALPTVWTKLLRARIELRKLMGIEEKHSEETKEHQRDRRSAFADSSEA